MRRALPLACLGLVAPLSAQIVLGPPAEFSTPDAMTDVAAGDVDEDGQVDLVTMPYPKVPFGPSVVGVFLGDGAGGFAPHSSIVLGSLGGRGELRDLDGDGHLDLLLAASTFADVPGAQWRLGAGDGSFGLPEGFWYGFSGSPPADFVHVLDLDGDGDRDYVVVQSGGPGDYPWAPIPGLVTIALDTGAGFDFTTKVTGSGTREVQAGDLDGDGVLDLLACSEGADSLSVLLGLGGGAFADPVTIPLGGAAMDLLLDELNGDGHLDAIIADFENWNVLTAKGKGDGTFKLLQQVPLGTGVLPRTVDRGDLDGDGVDDLVLSYFTQGISIVKGAADGTFSAVTRVAGMSQTGRSALADLDQDGDLDVAISTLGGPQRFYVSLNETYAAGSPFADLGQMQSPSIDLTPIQIASGDLLPGTPVAFDVFMAPPNHPVTFVVGLAQASLPFKGLVMVPSPDVLIGPIPSDPQGHLGLAANWPPGVPAGLGFVTQVWFPFAIGPAKLASSNAVAATVP